MYRSPLAPSPLVVSAFNGKVAAYDRTNGRTAWIWQAGGASFGLTHVRPTHVVVSEDRVFIVTAVVRASGAFSSKKACAETTALDYRTGTPLWAQSIDRDQAITSFAATILVDGGQVVVTHADVIVAFAADTGIAQWHRTSEHGDGGQFLPMLEFAIPYRTEKPFQ